VTCRVSNNTAHTLSRGTATTTTRFSTEGVGCQKQMAQSFCQQSDQVGRLGPAYYLASIHQMAPPKRGSTYLIIALLLIYWPRKDERLSWPSWLTYDNRSSFLRIRAAVVEAFVAFREESWLSVVRFSYGLVTIPVRFGHD